jgi:hypothetical protein
MNMRIHLLLQQATQSGMTGYYSILQAMRLFPEFPWEIINVLYPGELARFQAAVNEVGGRDYIGFWEGRVHARNRNYRHLMSVSVELLVQSGAEPTLKSYGPRALSGVEKTVWESIPTFVRTRNSEKIKLLIMGEQDAQTTQLLQTITGTQERPGMTSAVSQAMSKAV